MRHDSSKQLYDYWDKIRTGRNAPLREEIEPSDIRKLLGDTFILDISGVMHTISYRLAGTRLCAAYGQELKGLGFLVPWYEKDCFELTQAISQVYRNSIPQIICSTAKTNSGKFIEFETVLLPLMPTNENSFRILGLSSPSKTPYWLGAEPITSNHVRSIRPASRTQASSFTNASIAPDLNEDEKLGIIGTLHTNKAGSQRKVGHLTVHEGGKV